MLCLEEMEREGGRTKIGVKTSSLVWKTNENLGGVKNGLKMCVGPTQKFLIKNWRKMLFPKLSSNHFFMHFIFFPPHFADFTCAKFTFASEAGNSFQVIVLSYNPFFLIINFILFY